MFGLGLGRLGAVGGSRTLTQRALAILRTYGTDAHLWLPGVGVVNGITAGNFSDTAGTTPAVVDSTAGVGLVVDAGGGSINATQGTTAAKPILRQSSGRYSWQFDGTDDRLQLSAVPWGGSDDHCVVAGVSASSTAATRTIFAIGNTAATPAFYPYVRVTAGGTLTAQWRDDAAGLSSITGSAFSANIPFVISAKKIGNAKVARKDGVTFGTDNSARSASALTTAAMGALVVSNTSQFFIGNIGPVIAIKGTVSDADLLTLEKWIGSLSGVTI